MYEIMNFLIENQNNANQYSKFLTIITSYLNSKKLLTFPLFTKKIAQTNTKKLICQTKKINCNHSEQNIIFKPE